MTLRSLSKNHISISYKKFSSLNSESIISWRSFVWTETIKLLRILQKKKNISILQQNATLNFLWKVCLECKHSFSIMDKIDQEILL